MKNNNNIRLLAASIILTVTNGRSLTELLEEAFISLKDAHDRAFLQAICYGISRYYTRLDVVLSHLLEKPMRAQEELLHALIFVGLYQLMFMRVPPHAAVTETVNAVALLKKPWAKGLVNAILRNYLRKKTELDLLIESDEESKYAHPDWWINAIKKAWPEKWQQILSANNAHPPFSLRIKKSFGRENYLTLLAEKNIKAVPLNDTEAGIKLENPMPVTDLPRFREGDVYVQDGAAQLTTPLLKLFANARVLDACAAPGGKLMQILEESKTLSAIYALEKNPKRMKTIEENIVRCGGSPANLKLICADAKAVNTWWDQQLFDRILLDVPCSASGVIRRHPDIKLLRHAQDIKALAQEQLALLQAAWPLLAPQGLLLYITCSIFPAENNLLLEQFLSMEKGAVEEKIIAEWGMPLSVGRQILPGEHEMDGFYFACLRKN